MGWTSEMEPSEVEALEERAEALSDALKNRAQVEAELRRSRNLLAMAVDIAQVGTWAYDAEAEDVEANARWYVLHGLRTKPRQLSDLYPNLSREDRARVAAGLDDVFSGAARQWDDTYQTTDGRWIQSRMQRLDGADAGVVMATALDITDQKRVEAALAERVELQELLVGVASHDLKTPLTTARTALELIAQTAPDAGALRQQATTRGLRALARADRLVLDLLDVTRQRLDGAIPLRLAPCPLVAVVTEVVAAARFVEGDDVQVELSLSSERGEVLADRARVHQALVNLVDNAVEHAAPRRVEVSVAPEDRAGPGWRVEVTNPGPPIEPEVLPVVFEPFQRGHQTSASRRNLGLGLHIVKLIVEEHGGQVAVRSDDAGTRFTTWWPAAGPEGPSNAVASPADEPRRLPED